MMRVAAEVALGDRRGTDVHSLVGEGAVAGVGVGVGIDRDGGDPHPAGGVDDAAGDLAAVGDEDPGEHHIRNTPKRVSSIGAFSAARSDRATTSRVVRGSMMPSSQSRAEA